MALIIQLFFSKKVNRMASPLDYTAIPSDSSDVEVAEKNTMPCNSAKTTIPSASEEIPGSSGNQVFLELDFSKTRETSNCYSLESMPDMKIYRVKRKQGPQDISIVRIYKNNLKNVIPVIAQKLDIRTRDQSLVRFTYPLKTIEGVAELITINSWDKELTDALEMFYCQTENHSLLEVDISTKRPKREPHPSEKRQKILSKKHVIDKSVYETFQEEPELAETLLSKRRYLGVLLGNEEAVNLLNPSRFLCHVQSCTKGIIKLKSHCSLSSITEHWKNHVKSTTGEPSCDKLLTRHNYVKRNHNVPWKADVKVEDLEVPDLAIKNLMRGKLVVEAGQEFKGKYLLMKKDILEKIAQYDPTALENLHQDQRVL